MFIKEDEQSAVFYMELLSKGSGLALHLSVELYYNYVGSIAMHV